MKITEEQRTFLNSFIANLDEILLSGDSDELLLEIDSAIVRTFDADGTPNKDGIKLQTIYDDIYGRI